tara:strand:+ start:20 stop:799 length:780 start_codon:yes stop_codon:yes gene_type:complete
MATIDLGKIKQVWRGTYDNSTAYTVDDLVEYTDSGITSTYICVANSTGNAPSSSGTAHASWNYVAKGVADPVPTQSGNSGKFLTTNGSSASWGTVSQKIVQTKFQRFNTRISSTSQTYADTGMSIAMTPTNASNKLLLQGQLSVTVEEDTTLGIIAMLDSGSGYYHPEETKGADVNDRSRVTACYGYQSGEEQEYTIRQIALHIIIDCDNTNTHTVKLQFSNRDGSGKSAYINRTHHDNNAIWIPSPPSHITLSEVEYS